MGDNTKIQWTDHSASPWHGCSKVSVGCDHCYAERQSLRNPGVLGIWGDEGVRVKSKSFIDNLRAWNKIGEKEGRQIRVFPSICDPFEDRPELVPWRQEMFAVSDDCPWVTLLLLTKRPENIRRLWPEWACFPGLDENTRQCSRSNIWLGTSVSDQATADKMVPELLRCRNLSPVLFLSAEPLLGPIDFEMIRDPERFPGCAYFDVLRGRMIHEDDENQWTKEPAIDWVIVGGESGPRARPCNADWVRGIVWQCEEPEVPCFVKQLGASPRPGPLPRDVVIRYVKDPKGGEMSEWPEDLRCREFPTVKA